MALRLKFLIGLIALCEWQSPPCRAEKLYWACTQEGFDKIQRADLNGANVEDILVGTRIQPRDIAVDLTENVVYWSDGVSNYIAKSNLDGTGLEFIVTTGLQLPIGVAFDSIARKVYWSDGPSHSIKRCNPDGTLVQTVVGSTTGTPLRLALDLIASKVYWSDYSAGKIRRANLNGGNIQDVVVGLTNLGPLALDHGSNLLVWGQGNGLPNGSIWTAQLDGSNAKQIVFPILDADDLSLDVQERKVYWTESLWNGQVWRADLDGNGDREPVVTLTTQATGLELVASKLYWADFIERSIRRANVDGSAVENVVTGGLGQVLRLAVDRNAVKLYWTGGGAVHQSKLNGDQPTIAASQLRIPVGIDVNEASGDIFWADAGTGKIQRAIAGGPVIDLYIGEVDGPRGLALAPLEDRMFWTHASTTSYIRRSRLDGSGMLNIVDDQVGYPMSIRCDSTGEWIYWSDLEQGTIRRSRLDGSDNEVVIAGLDCPTDLVVHASGKIYWANCLVGGFGQISRSNLDGSEPEVVVAGMDGIFGLTITCIPIIYGDLNDSGSVDVDDVLAVLSDFVDVQGGVVGDIFPCGGGDGVIDVDDILAALNAFMGLKACPDSCT